MLLDNFLEARVVKARKLGKIVNVGDNVGELFLEVLKLLLVGRGVEVQLLDDGIDLALSVLDSARNLAILDLLEGVDLVELGLKEADEALLVLLGPLVLLESLLEVRLEVIVGDVVVVVVSETELVNRSAGGIAPDVPDERRLEVLTKLHC